MKSKRILDEMIGELVQVITVQSASEETSDGTIYSGPMAINGVFRDYDDEMILIDPEHQPMRAVFRAHIVCIDSLDAETLAAKEAMNDPGKQGAH